MSFKRKLSGGMVFFVLATSGCGLYEGPPKEKSKTFNNEEMKCLNHFKSKLEDYFNGAGDENEIDRLASCLNLSFDQFVKHTRGENHDRFTAQEVRNFLKHYILEDLTVSDSLVREIMLLKKTFIGGKDSDFTHSDIETGKRFVNDMAELLKKLHPYLPMDFKKLVENEDERSLNLATAAYIDVAKTIGDIIQNKNAVYTFADLNRLMSEFEEAFPTVPFFKNIKKDLPRVVRLKNQLVTPFKQNQDVTAAQWKAILTEGAEWMAVYLKYNHLVQHNKDLTRGKARDRLVEVFDDATVLVDRLIMRHNGTLSFASIEGFMDEFGYDGSFFGAKLSPQTVKDSIKPIIKRVLSGADATESGRLSMGMKRTHLEKLQLIFHEWAEFMRVSEAVYAKQSGNEQFPKSLSYTNDVLLGVDLSEFIKESDNPVFTGSIAKELSGLIAKYPAFVVGDSNKLTYSNDIKTRAKSFHDITRWTWLRPIFKYLMLGYMSPDRASRASPEKIDREGLLVSEFKVFIADLWPALLDLKFVGTRFNSVESDTKKRFLESSLFMFSSDGDARISVDEGLQLVLYMISANEIGDVAHRTASQSCKTSDRDEFNKLKVEPLCYQKIMYDFDAKKAPLKDLWTSFPRWVKYYTSLDQAKRNEFKKLIMKICGRPDGKTNGEWTGSDDTDTLIMLMHYIETLFARYDTNQNETLNPQEAQKSWALFKRTLSETPGTPDDDEQLEAVFAYILANGQPPEVDGWWDKIGFGWSWVRNLEPDWSGFEFETDRSKILMVFDKIKPKSKAAVAPKK